MLSEALGAFADGFSAQDTRRVPDSRGFTPGFYISRPWRDLLARPSHGLSARFLRFQVSPNLINKSMLRAVAMK